MSIKTWESEFYPTEARTVPKDRRAALEHSLRKWRGLRAEALARHEMGRAVGDICAVDGSGDIFPVNSDTCALCVHWFGPYKGCSDCPLAEELGHPCAGSDHWAFNFWGRTGDPEPMIAALEAALKKEIGL